MQYRFREFNTHNATTKDRVASARWYKQSTDSVKRANDFKIDFKDKNSRSKMDLTCLGQMFVFFYDPKTKEKLQYYDTFPVVFVVKMERDGFIGLNLHYLPLMMRMQLMNALYSLINNDNQDKTTRLRLTNNILKSMSRFSYYKPCIKKYLFSHVKQKFLWIGPADWDKALLLPTERFVKKNKSFVHTESTRKLNVQH
jgi:hypothetical protein